MKGRIQKIKAHLRENKRLYLTGGLCFLGGALTVAGHKGTIQIVDSFNVKYKSSAVNVVIAELARRGHPGNLVKCNETGEVFASQNRAAEALGIFASDLSRHLRGKSAHAGGYTFEKLGEAV